MKGKIVNICMALMNIALGALIIFYTIYVPSDKTLLTVQENTVVNGIIFAINIVLSIIVFIDIIQCFNHRTDTGFNFGYLLGIFSLSFFSIKEPAIGLFGILSGLIILFKSLKENLVELNSTTGISVALVMIATIGIISAVSYNYALFGENIKNKENKNETPYKENYFDYVTELGINEPYINVKKDGKYGYINPRGEVVIDFKYDYASPFVRTKIQDKNFEIALVCYDGSSHIILKNERVVMSYRTESSDDNFKAKQNELEDIYKNVLKQTEEMEYEIEMVDNHIKRIPVYQDTFSNDYDFRYNYNSEYDILVTQSNMGLGDTYEFAKKADLNIRLPLDAENLDYDSSYLYLFSNGTIPFYELSHKTQGWFTSYGQKKAMTGKAQMLDFYSDKILLKNYNDKTIYFIDFTEKIISDKYKDIYICNDGRYIVQSEENTFKVINENFEKAFEAEFASINPRLIKEGIYLTLTSTDDIKFNDYNFAKFKWNLVNYDGNVILDNVEEIYDVNLEYDGSLNKKDEEYTKMITDFIKLNYKFVGDKFYLNY